MVAVKFYPPLNSRRPRQEYKDNNRAMVATTAEVARSAYMGRTKLLVIADMTTRK